MGGLSSLFGGGGGGFSGGGIGSSANTTTNTTDNKNNAITGDDANIYDTRGGSLTYNITDGGIASRAFDFGDTALDFATQVNQRAAQNLSEGTIAILDKVTVDSGQRIQAVTETYGKYLAIAAAIAAAVLLFKR